MRHCRLTHCDKCSTLVGDTDGGQAVFASGKEGIWANLCTFLST